MQLWGEWVGIPVIAAVGVLLVIQRHVTGSLTAPILTHLSYNTVLIAMSWIVADGV
jgi:membrane protease YdiL (CAAX protease family)